MKLAPHHKRLFVALAVSSALHVALVVLPYLGASLGVSLPFMKKGPTEGPVSTLTARLVMDNGAPTPVEDGPEMPIPEESSLERAAQQEEPQPSVNRPGGIEALPMVGPTYFTADQLTRTPRPMFSPKLALPPELEAQFGTGRVVLKLWIDRLGNVVAADVGESNVPEPVAAKAAEAFRNLRFVPGEINGRHVNTMIQYEVTYEDSPVDSSANGPQVP